MPRARFAALIVLCSGCAAPAEAQRLANLFGRVLDTSEAGIADAGITVVNEDTGFRRATASVPGGAYSVNSLEPGVYKITVRKEGFRAVVRFGVSLVPACAARADFVLPVGSIEESITVLGTAPLLSQEDATAGGQFDREDVERVPLNGRGLLTLLELVPGTNVIPATRGEAGQFTVSGQRPNTNYFMVDGVSANTGVSAGGVPAQFTGGSLPPLSAFGSLDSVISLEAVQDFRAQTSTAVAEFGRLPGAGVALSSRSGSNEFHGSLASRFRHELPDANDWFGNEAGYGRAALRLQDGTGTIGGPLLRNRTFFFLSYERMALRQPYVWKQPVPSVDSRQQVANWAVPVVSLFPEPNRGPLAGDIGEWVGRDDRPAGLQAGSARIDHAITPRVTFFGRYSDSPSSNEFGSLQVNRLELRLQSLTLGLNARPGGRTVMDFRANESLAAAHSVWSPGDAAGTPGCGLEPLTTVFLGYAASCDYLVRFSIGGLGQLVSGREGDRRQRQFQVVQSTTLTRDSHAVKFGADYRSITAVRRDETGTLGVIADTMSDLLDQRNVWIARSAAIRRSAEVRELSLWVQDTWRATQRLTVAMGLRWEFSPAPLPPDPAFFYNYISDSVQAFRKPLWPPADWNFAPRLGMAWRLGGDGRTVLRAGGGLYYDSSLSIATDIINSGPLGVSQFGSGRTAPFSSLLSFGFMPDLHLPEVAQWNAALERAFGTHDVLSLGYVGSAGRSLMRREVGGLGTAPTSWVALTGNGGSSDYHALQAQYRRHVARGLQAIGSYTWSHSLDDDSSDAFLLWAGSGSNARTDRGSSDFDLRHSLTASLSYEFAAKPGSRFPAGWGIDAVLHARGGFPITVLDAEQYTGVALVNAFRPDPVPGQPMWFSDALVPGGRRLNPAAFSAAAPGVQGGLGRNGISGFGMSQLDLALKREFRPVEHCRIQLRIEAFNALNHPNFADPVKYLNSPMFGQSTSMLNMMLGTGSPGSGLAPILQTGGPRTMQGSLRVQF